MTRIKYTEVTPGVLHSGWMLAERQMVMVKATLKMSSYFIVNDKNVVIHFGSTNGASRKKLLKCIKDDLKALGVSVFDEVRTKDT